MAYQHASRICKKDPVGEFIEARPWEKQRNTLHVVSEAGCTCFSGVKIPWMIHNGDQGYCFTIAIM